MNMLRAHLDLSGGCDDINESTLDFILGVRKRDHISGD
jgi:hypothetical protein